MAQNFTIGGGYLATATVTKPGGAPTEIPVKMSAIADTIRVSPTTNSMSGAYPIQLTSYLGARFNITVDRNYYAGNNPYGSALSITVGTVMTNVTIYEQQSGRGNLDGSATQVGVNVLIVSTNESLNTAAGSANVVSFIGEVTGPTGSRAYPSA